MRHVADIAFRYGFLPTVLLLASVKLIREVAAFFAELRDDLR